MNRQPGIKGQQREATTAEQTRTALVHAALKLFGRQGFDGTSTREIAAEAKANIGSIA
jgi:AcrR family transcriptional regulator